MPSPSHTWGTQAHERQRPFPCDRFITPCNDEYYRGITILAPKETIFRWLCQMRLAPYSYDWIDNFGRKSPQRLTPGLDKLAVGQEVMTIFELVDFVPDRHFTIRIKRYRIALRMFGDIALSYVIVSKDPQTCRVLVKLVLQYPKGVVGRLVRLLLPWADLIMMRRQLLNFKALAEHVPNGI